MTNRMYAAYSFISRNPLYLLLALGVLLVTPLVLLSDMPEPDVVIRYAPMSEAIARADWKVAFHPRVPPLLPLAGGAVVWLSGCSGFTAVQLISALCFILGVIPLYLMMRQVYNERTAVIACCLYLFCSYLLRLASSGLRENAKCLALLCATWALLQIWKERRRLRNYLLLGIFCGGLTLIRDDSVSLAMGLLTIALILEILRHQLPWRSFTAGLAMLVLLIPLLIQNYHSSGYPVPSVRFAKIMQEYMPPYIFSPKARPQVPEPQPSATTAAPIAAISKAPVLPVPLQCTPPAPGLFSVLAAKTTTASFLYFLREFFKGIYLVFILPVPMIVVGRMRKGTWNGGDTILMLVFAGHTLIQVLQVAVFDQILYIDRRYLLPAVPLALGWTALFVVWIQELLTRRFSAKQSKAPAIALCVIALLLLSADTLMPILKRRYSGPKGSARQAVQKWAVHIRTEYTNPPQADQFSLDQNFYRSWRRPLVCCKDLPELGYLSGGESYLSGSNDRFIKEQTADYLATQLPPEGLPPQYPGYTLVEVLELGAFRYALWRKAAEISEKK